MQFQVPQYFEVKEKIVGPFTLVQFFYIAAACGLSFLLFFIFQIWLWFILSVILVGAACALALVEINGQSLVKILWAAFFYYWQPRTFLWQRETERVEIKEIQKELGTHQKLKNLAQKILTSRSSLPGEKLGAAKVRERYQVFRKTTGEREVVKRVDYR